MTSDDLAETQNTLEEIAKIEIDNPATDYVTLRKFIEMIEIIDRKRRDLWHEEQFGPYEDIVNNISEDDIPF